MVPSLTNRIDSTPNAGCTSPHRPVLHRTIPVPHRTTPCRPVLPRSTPYHTVQLCTTQINFGNHNKHSSVCKQRKIFEISLANSWNCLETKFVLTKKM